MVVPMHPNKQATSRYGHSDASELTDRKSQRQFGRIRNTVSKPKRQFGCVRITGSQSETALRMHQNHLNHNQHKHLTHPNCRSDLCSVNSDASELALNNVIYTFGCVRNNISKHFQPFRCVRVAVQQAKMVVPNLTNYRTTT